MGDIYDDYIRLLKIAIEGEEKDVIALARKNFSRITKVRPDLTDSYRLAISKNGTMTRGYLNQPIPIDMDSKLELLKRDISAIEIEPTWAPEVEVELNAIVAEREQEGALLENGLSPTKSVLLVGQPGVGKTLAAKWLSEKLDRPLYTLDLAAVMSSFLGRTGNNIRTVLNFAQSTPSILLLDEFDAIAKKRNDEAELGELKRLVNVLLQAVDGWPSTGILIAATNHPEMLDVAVWRRFERIIEFPCPTSSEIESLIRKLIGNESNKETNQIIKILSTLFTGVSYSEVIRQINIARRNCIIKQISLDEALSNLIKILIPNTDKESQIQLAMRLSETSLTQRRVSEITGVSRDTIRKRKSTKQK